MLIVYFFETLLKLARNWGNKLYLQGIIAVTLFEFGRIKVKTGPIITPKCLYYPYIIFFYKHEKAFLSHILNVNY